MNLPSTPLVFLAITAAGRGSERRAWEIAGVRLETDGTTRERLVYVKNPVIPNADPAELEATGYYERHPQYAPERAVPNLGPRILDQHPAAQEVERLTRRAVVVSASPSSDLDTLGRTLRQLSLTPAWHEQPVDLVSASLGWIFSALGMAMVPPVRPGMLAALCGVEPVEHPCDFDTAPALERARVCLAWWRALQPPALVACERCDAPRPEDDATCPACEAREKHPSTVITASPAPTPLNVERARRRQLEADRQAGRR